MKQLTFVFRPNIQDALDLAMKRINDSYGVTYRIEYVGLYVHRWIAGNNPHNGNEIIQYRNTVDDELPNAVLIGEHKTVVDLLHRGWQYQKNCAVIQCSIYYSDITSVGAFTSDGVYDINDQVEIMRLLRNNTRGTSLDHLSTWINEQPWVHGNNEAARVRL